MKRFGYFVFLFFIIQTSSAFASAIPDVQTYDGLLHAIREVRSASEKRVEQAVDAEKVREAWETGKLIDEHILQHKERADYGEKVIARLADDLGMSSRELHYMLEFFRTYPIVRPGGQLSWSKYQALLSINDDKARGEVAEKAVRQNWDRDRVREEVQRYHARDRSEEKLPVSKPESLYIYRVVKPAEGPYAGQLALDLGFAVTFRPREFDLSQSKEGDVVAFENKQLIAVKNEPTHTYHAYVTEIIDGDTLHARIDLGFGITIEQKLRLRGLDAPIVESSDGREAKAFLEKHFPASGTPVLIQTVKSDKYDRYLADIWVDGTCINQKLIDQGLAVRVSE